MAVYTEVTDEALAEFLTDYDIGTMVAFRGIAEGVENSNYSLRTTAGDFILTLYERRVDPNDLPWFLGLMEHLAHRGLVCPQPVHGRDGAALRHLCGRHAAITTFLPGVWPRRVRQAHCGPVGAALAKLHLAGADYAPRRRKRARPAKAGRRCWNAAGRAPMRCRPGWRGNWTRRWASSWPHGRPALPVGHIHADLFPDNVFFLDDQVSGVIDFYFAATDLLAYDIAVCLNAWCFEPDFSFNVTKSKALLAAYRSRPPAVGGRAGRRCRCCARARRSASC